MTSGVERSCLGTVVRIFPTQRQFEVHRRGLRTAGQKRFSRNALIFIGGFCVLLLIVLEGWIFLSGSAVDRGSRLLLWGGSFLSVFLFFVDRFVDLRNAKEDSDNEFVATKEMHCGQVPVAWEVRLETGETVILKGFSGRTGDHIGVNFIGDWTPSIVNLTDNPKMEQRALEFGRPQPDSLFFSATEYREFLDGEKYRLRDFELRRGKKTVLDELRLR